MQVGEQAEDDELGLGLVQSQVLVTHLRRLLEEWV